MKPMILINIKKIENIQVNISQLTDRAYLLIKVVSPVTAGPKLNIILK